MTSRTDSFLAGLVLAGALLALAVPGPAHTDDVPGSTAALLTGQPPSDYVLTVGGERICAKSAAACAEAREAIRTGRWPIAPKDAPTGCAAAPEGCFSRASNCIAGYNNCR